jgi:hypothetical protein
MQDLPRALPVGVRSVRCACANCGVHLEGTASANGVSGFCTNCFSYDVVALPVPAPAVTEVPRPRRAPKPPVFGAAA